MNTPADNRKRVAMMRCGALKVEEGEPVCRNGHPRTEENTRVNKEGHLKCRICERVAVKRHELRKEIAKEEKAHQISNEIKQRHEEEVASYGT